jgi:hypothetical protein
MVKTPVITNSYRNMMPAIPNANGRDVGDASAGSSLGSRDAYSVFIEKISTFSGKKQQDVLKNEFAAMLPTTQHEQQAKEATRQQWVQAKFRALDLLRRSQSLRGKSPLEAKS